MSEENYIVTNIKDAVARDQMEDKLFAMINQEDYQQKYGATIKKLLGVSINVSELINKTGFQFQIYLNGMVTKKQYVSATAVHEWIANLTKYPIPEVVDVEKEAVVGEILRLKVGYYPSCCAMVQCNGFYYSQPSMPEEVVHKALDMVADLSYRFITNSASRMIFNFVKYNDVEVPRSEKKALTFKFTKEQEESGTFLYPFVQSWASKQADYREMTCYNVNSGNRIHTALVVPSL